MPIFWNDKYEIGNEVIDQQHMRLVSIYNILEETFYEHRNIDTVRSVFENFRDYIQYHLSLEELVMNEENTIEDRGYYIKHQVLINKVQRCLKRSSLDQEESFEEIIKYFRQCLEDHLNIEKPDKVWLINKNPVEPKRDNI